MKFPVAAVAIALAACSHVTTESWECNHRSTNNEPIPLELTVDGNFLMLTRQGMEIGNGQAVVSNTMFNNSHRVVSNDELGLVAVLSVALKNPDGRTHVATETLLVSKDTGAFQISWMSTDPEAAAPEPIQGTCRRLN